MMMMPKIMMTKMMTTMMKLMRMMIAGHLRQCSIDEFMAMGGFFVKCQGQTFRRVSLMRDVEDDGDHDRDDDDIFSNVNVKPQ